MDEEIEESVFETILEKQGLSPRIRVGSEWNAQDDYNTVVVRLDGRAEADLDWSKARIQAEQAISQGLSILWDIDLGLFDQLKMPLENQTQFLSLEIALGVFCDFLQPRLREHSVGICLYRGSGVFSETIHWYSKENEDFDHWKEGKQGDDERLLRAIFARDLCVDYLTLLSTKLSDVLPLYLDLDMTSIQDPIEQLQLLNPERFEAFHLLVKGCRIPVRSLVWKENCFQQLPLDCSVALCCPSHQSTDPYFWEQFRVGVNGLMERGIPYKVIPENQLTANWDGLDYVIYHPRGLGPQGKRKLLGFCAAGGIPVSLGETMGLPGEEQFFDFGLDKKAANDQVDHESES